MDDRAPARQSGSRPASRDVATRTGDPAGVALILVERVSFRYPGRLEGRGRALAIEDVDLAVGRGEIVALIGHNGSGKSTLARHLNGLLKPATGRVLVRGEDTREVGVARLAARVGYAFQNPDHQLFAPTVAEDIAFGPRNLGLPPDEVARRVAEAQAALGLDDVAGRHPLLLGHGRRRLVALAGVLALGAEVLVLDEPTVGLDRRAADRVLAILHERRAAGGSALLITHDLALVADHASRVVLLLRGRVAADGPTRSILTDTALLTRSGLAPPAVTQLGQALDPHGVRPDALTVDELCDSYATAWRRRGLRTE